jgi:hypothetical protein
MQCRVDIQATDETSKEELQKLLVHAEYSCVNLQTLSKGVEVETAINF